MALDQLIRSERIRADVAAYQRRPPSQDEIQLASLGDASGLADDTDWAALYATTFMSAAVRRGEVWLADLDKPRPVIVLTRDPFGRLLHSVIVAPVTSTCRSRRARPMR